VWLFTASEDWFALIAIKLCRVDLIRPVSFNALRDEVLEILPDVVLVVDPSGPSFLPTSASTALATRRAT